MTSILYFIFEQVRDKKDQEIISYDVFLMTALKYYDTCGIYSAPRPDGEIIPGIDYFFVCRLKLRKPSKTRVCVSVQVSKHARIPVLSELDATIRGLLCHIVCIQSYCVAMWTRVWVTSGEWGANVRAEHRFPLEPSGTRQLHPKS